MSTKTVVAIAFFMVWACAAPNTAPDHRQTERNLSLARRVFTQIYGDGKVALVDQLYADDFVDDSPGGGRGRELIKEAVARFHTALPDLRIDIEDAFAVDDKVVVRYTARGTQTGPYYDIPPSGKAVVVRGITIFQIVRGKIKTEWTEYDRLGVMKQIGAIPSS